MSVFGLLVVFAVVWWVVFFAALPFGIRRQEKVEPGHDPGAPASPMLWRKTAATTGIALVLVGSGWLADHVGLIDFRELLFGEVSKAEGRP